MSLLAILCLGGCGKGDRSTPENPGLTLFVAASLTDVIQAIGALYEETHAVDVHYNFAGSGTLAQQLIAAPRADLFISASEQWMDAVEERGRLLPGTRQTLLSNQLVIIANPGADFNWKDPTHLPDLPFAFLAMGDPTSVPAGRYAREWLESLSTADGSSAWSGVLERISPAPDVRAALTQVTGRRDVIGIVYRTDYIARRDTVNLLYEVAVADGPAIRYPIAILNKSVHPDHARDFLSFLRTPAARELFQEYGFTLMEVK